MHRTASELLEDQRIKEESERNDRRFDKYNDRRRAAGLPELCYVDYLCRKHNMPTMAERTRIRPHLSRTAAAQATLAEHRLAQQKLAASPKPENRDNVFLLTR